jgi:hypothetical protein
MRIYLVILIRLTHFLFESLRYLNLLSFFDSFLLFMDVMRWIGFYLNNCVLDLFIIYQLRFALLLFIHLNYLMTFLRDNH